MNLTEDGSGFIRKLFMRHVWPGVAAQIMSVVGPLVCGMMAGKTFGKTGLAVTGLYAPFFFLAAFFGTIIAGGSTMLATKYVANDDSRRVGEIYTLALALAALCSAALFALCVLFRAPVLALLAGGGELLEPASSYYVPAVLYSCFTIIVHVPLFWARLAGKPVVPIVLALALSGASVAFGYLFISVFGLGLEALAAAQALATVLALAVSLAMLSLPENGLQLRRPGCARKDAAALIFAGSPPGLSRLYRFLSLFLLNMILLNAAGTGAVAALGVINILLRFVTAFISGISGVQMPIAGVLREERDMASLRQLARVSFVYGNAAVLIAVAAVLLFRRNVAAMFGIEAAALFPALACFCAYIPFYLNGGLFVSWYTAVKRVRLANIVTLAQDMVFLPLAAFLLALTGGATAIWLYMPAAGLLTTISLLSTRFFAKPEPMPGSTALAFSVERDAGKASEASAAVGGFCGERGMDAKRVMLLSLAIEEIISLIAEQNADGGAISVRLTLSDDRVILRFRDAGRMFNAVNYYRKNLREGGDMESAVGLLGIKYIVETAKTVHYRETFGVNNLVVAI